MKKTKFQRILAIIALVLIACLYAATVIFALIDSPLAKSCLMAALFCTIVVPPVIYGFLVITKQFTGGQKKMDDMRKQDGQTQNLTAKKPKNTKKRK